MKKLFDKMQLVVFGQFNLPPTPDVVIRLVKAFSTLNLVPNMVNQLDPFTGLLQLRVSLSNGKDLQIMFGADRIDVQRTVDLQNSVVDVDGEKLLVEIIAILNTLELDIERIGYVADTIWSEVSGVLAEKYRSKYLPISSENCSEWHTKWTGINDDFAEKQNVGVEVSRVVGVMTGNFGMAVPFDGLKFQFDISTLKDSNTPRFKGDLFINTFYELQKTLIAKRAEICCFEE